MLKKYLCGHSFKTHSHQIYCIYLSGCRKRRLRDQTAINNIAEKEY